MLHKPPSVESCRIACLFVSLSMQGGGVEQKVSVCSLFHLLSRFNESST